METPKTYFDDPARSSRQKILQESDLISKEPLVKNILEGFPELAVILDYNRQIVACNSKAVKGFGKNSLDEVLGKRVGEAINCIHSNEMGSDTCGTSKFCAHCGAAQAIKHTKDTGTHAEEECRITSDFKGSEISFDFKVNTSPLKIANENFTLFAVRDISGDKRQQALERIFFHDVLNTASVIRGFADILDDTDEDEFMELLNSLKESSNQLIDEIQMQRTLRYAEDGKLEIDLEDISVSALLKKVHSLYTNHPLAEGKKVTLIPFENNLMLKTDQILLLRSLGNIVKNALEASKDGDEIRVWAEDGESSIIFRVQNPGVIPDDVQHQIFKRSFSTKFGKGRGIGTYSVKLLVEQYLKGKVSFVSNEIENTIFSISLSLNQ